jgi:hypothetical protein
MSRASMSQNLRATKASYRGSFYRQKHIVTTVNDKAMNFNNADRFYGLRCSRAFKLSQPETGERGGHPENNEREEKTT